jgi:succinoglycan biosynthesis protein ExoA
MTGQVADNSSMTTGRVPSVSVIMPIRNEADFIAQSLGAVLAQDYPRDRLQVIVADGCSDDGTQAIIGAMAARDARLTILENRGRIVATGINQALAIATGEIVVRVDGHCEIAADYVRRCVAHLQAGEAEGVGGPLETIGQTPVARAIALVMSSKFGVGNSAFRTVSGETRLVDTVAFPAYTRAVIDRVGPFDVELVRNQDDEFNYRLRKRGGRLLLAADVRARYYSRSSLKSLWRQYFQYGYWKVRVLQKHPRQMSARQFIPPLFVAGLALGLVSTAWPAGRVFLGLYVGAYVLANVAASVASARRVSTVAGVMTVPLAFAMLHLSYGSGFLVGLLKFWNRWREGAPAESLNAPTHP